MRSCAFARHLSTGVIGGMFSLAALAQTPAALNGTWVIDAKQTEERLIKIGPPPQNAEWLPAIILRLCVTTMTFEGNVMTIDPIGPAPTTQSFRLEPQPGKELTYIFQTLNGERETLTISFLNEENITIRSEKVGLDEYGVWKRGKRPNRQTAGTDFKQAFDACTSALNNVPFIKARTR